MAKFNATDLVLKINGTPIAHSTSATLNINQDLPDATWGEQDLSDATWGEQDLSDATWSTQTVS